DQNQDGKAVRSHGVPPVREEERMRTSFYSLVGTVTLPSVMGTATLRSARSRGRRCLLGRTWRASRRSISAVNEGEPMGRPVDVPWRMDVALVSSIPRVSHCDQLSIVPGKGLSGDNSGSSTRSACARALDQG